MAEKTATDQYGRKTWNLEAYEEEAKRGKTTEVSDDTLSTIQKLKGQTLLAQRKALLNSSISAVGKHTLINADKSTTATFGKNKRFGFYCSICDLSFRDTLALIDHFNSPQHVSNVSKLTGAGTGESLENGIKRASVEEVVSTLEQLVKQSLRANKDSSAESLQARIKKRQEFEEKRAASRREKSKRRKLDIEPETEIGKIMGFEGFGSKS